MDKEDDRSIASLHGRADLDFEVMTESHSHDGLQDTIGILPAHAQDVDSAARLAPREGRIGELWGGRPCHALPPLSLSLFKWSFTLWLYLYIYTLMA